MIARIKSFLAFNRDSSVFLIDEVPRDADKTIIRRISVGRFHYRSRVVISGSGKEYRRKSNSRPDLVDRGGFQAGSPGASRPFAWRQRVAVGFDCAGRSTPQLHRAMPKVPQAIVGIDFDERFFDAVIRRAGGDRLEAKYKPPKDTKSVDYLIDGWAIELKILVTDPLDANERQASIKKFIKEKFPDGGIWASQGRQAVSLSGEVFQEYWERYLGAPAQDRIASAAKQIAATRTFVPEAEARHGGVLLVNSAGWSVDWRSFVKLCGKYQCRFPEVDAVFPVSGVPSPTDAGPQIQFGGTSKKKLDPDFDLLFDRLSNAFKAEIEQRTASPLRLDENVDINADIGKSHFHITPEGKVLKKRAQQPQ